MKKREFRAAGSVSAKSDGNTLFGYIALFNAVSEDLGGFREMLSPGCFRSSLTNGSDIKALVNHNTSACVGSTASGTLRLSEDEKGLAYELDLPDTSSARDVRELVGKGIVKGCSFGFFCNEADWTKRDGVDLRVVKDVELFEVSTGVTFPAYTDTSSQLRALFPDGDVRDDGEIDDSVETNTHGCLCVCNNCVAGDCASCTDPDCTDENCLANRALHDKLHVATLPIL